MTPFEVLFDVCGRQVLLPEDSEIAAFVDSRSAPRQTRIQPLQKASSLLCEAWKLERERKATAPFSCLYFAKENIPLSAFSMKPYPMALTKGGENARLSKEV